MEEQSPDVRKAVELFWRLLEVTGYLDEHGAYQKISEALRSFEEKEEENNHSITNIEDIDIFLPDNLNEGNEENGGIIKNNDKKRIAHPSLIFLALRN